MDASGGVLRTAVRVVMEPEGPGEYALSWPDDLIGLTCPKEHRFEYDKHRCPRCGSTADPAKWDIVRASSFLPFPEGKVFKSAQCTSPSTI